jgi:hypothetical protein
MRDKKEEQPCANAVRDALLAELRCELILSKLATTGLERVGVALKHDLISVPQAIVLLNADDPIRWLYLGGGPDNA